MLVLSRKVGQELTIGDNIRITVHRICGNRVTLGIAAPQATRVLRGELQPFTTISEVEVEVEASVEEVVAAPFGVDLTAHGPSPLEMLAGQTH